MQKLNRIPVYVSSLFLKLVVVLLMMSITRILFHVFNAFAFQNIEFYDYLIGFWFDCITVALFFLPYLIFCFLPIPILWKQTKLYALLDVLLYFATTALLIGLNLMDIEYFKYTSKRSTIDLMTILTAGSDLEQLITTFISDFWFIILFFIIIFSLIIWWYKRFNRKTKLHHLSPLQNLAYLLICVALFVFIGRGGWVFKPVNVLYAATLVEPSKTALVLNTPFTMVKSFSAEGLKEKHFYKDIAETERYFNPIKTSQPQHLLPDSTNVVFLILESFGKEYVGFYNGGKTYSPFLDSLLGESLTFMRGFSNGKKSIEAVPSIFASLPSLQNSPFISSQYNSNQVIGLPRLLKKFGYESAFFHGATNGSMRFDVFADYIGFDHYFGKKEYGNNKHSDKTWGILDEYFNPWTAQMITQKLKEPFLASLFTLSSHHPYFVPEHRRDEVIHGDQPMCASISYADLSLKLFFEEAKKQPWFERTVFFICADHTAGTTTPFYNLRTQLYQIPFAIYHPKGLIKKGKSEQIFQQTDIYPTVLDLLNIQTKYYSFGNSLYKKGHRFAISYLEGSYFYFENEDLLIYSKNEARNLYDYTSENQEMIDISESHKSKVETYSNMLEAIIQRYNHDMIRNKTKVE